MHYLHPKLSLIQAVLRFQEIFFAVQLAHTKNYGTMAIMYVLLTNQATCQRTRTPG